MTAEVGHPGGSNRSARRRADALAVNVRWMAVAQFGTQGLGLP